MTVIERSEDEIVAEVMDAMPQMKGWREAEIGWRVWTQDAIRRALALTADRGAVDRIRDLEQALDRAADDLRSLGHFEMSERAYAPLGTEWGL